MTITEHLAKHLTDHGLWPDEAAAVLGQMATDDKLGALTVRWGDDVTGYPPQLLDVLQQSANFAAVKWIDANALERWARPMFTGEVPA